MRIERRGGGLCVARHALGLDADAELLLRHEPTDEQRDLIRSVRADELLAILDLPDDAALPERPGHPAPGDT